MINFDERTFAFTVAGLTAVHRRIFEYPVKYPNKFREAITGR